MLVVSFMEPYFIFLTPKRPEGAEPWLLSECSEQSNCITSTALCQNQKPSEIF